MRNSEKRKFKKRKSRERDKKKDKVAKKKPRFRLEALVDGKWKVFDLFSNKDEVDTYIDLVEQVRRKGDTRIFAGRFLELKTNKYIKFIERFDPMDVTSNLDDVKNIND